MRIRELDGIRGIAVLLVVIHHYTTILRLGTSTASKLIVRVLASGWFGVDVFFVLSGFLITGILLNRSQDWKHFYASRAFRILPASMIVLCVVLANVPRPSHAVVLSYFLFLGNYTILTLSEVAPLGHFWSLAVEEQFYLFWPQFALRLPKRAILRLALSIAALSIACRVIAVALHWNAYKIYKITPTGLDGIALGCALAAAMQIPEASHWLKGNWKKLAWISATIFVSGFVALKLSCFGWDVRAQLFAIPAVSILTCSMIYGSVEKVISPALARGFGNNVLVYFGQRSFGLYLVHEPIRYVLSHFMSAGKPLAHAGASLSFALAVIGVCLSMITAEMSWQLVEQPAQRLKASLSNRRSEMKNKRADRSSPVLEMRAECASRVEG